MPGWKLQNGNLIDIGYNDVAFWQAFNHVFSNSSQKRNSYKYGIIKSFLDNIQICNAQNNFILPYYELFDKFTENYWNMITRYHLKQMRPDGKSSISLIEKIILDIYSKIPKDTEYEQIDIKTKNRLINLITKNCKQYVLGALYNDFNGVIYGFDLKEPYLQFNKNSVYFMMKYKLQLEKLNYYSWAQFIESINSENECNCLLHKLENLIPQRNNLTEYKNILLKHTDPVCFYCGKPLQHNHIHVDHFIPWSYIHADHLWNLVLSCPTCNCKKNNKLCPDSIPKIINRNSMLLQDSSLEYQMKNYDKEQFIASMQYAIEQGYQTIKLPNTKEK